MINEFLWASSIKDAVQKKKENPNAQFIAGGTWINNFDNKEKPEIVIGLEKLELNKINAKNGCFTIQSGVNIQEIVDNKSLPSLLREAAKNVASRNIRNMATIGGEIALSSSYSDIIPALIALNASVKLAEDQQVYVCDYMKSKEKSLIVSIEIPNQENRFSAVQKFTRTHNGTPLLQVAVSLEKEENKVKNPIIALGCIEDTVIRIEELEEELDNNELANKDELEKNISKFISAKTDWRASDKFKEHVAGVIISDLLCICFEEDK